MDDDAIERLWDSKVREAYERKSWQPMKLEGAREDAEMAAAYMDSQSAELDSPSRVPWGDIVGWPLAALAVAGLFWGGAALWRWVFA